MIGGGFIGVEVASSLAARGLSVTLLERSPALWAGSLDERLSAWAVARLEEAGVTVRLSASVSSVEPEGVSIADEKLAADLVVAGVGVEPRVRLAQDAGLEVEDGVVVDLSQRASAAGIFAAGDMKLSTRAEYGIRVLVALARAEGGGPVSLTTVARTEKLPHAGRPAGPSGADRDAG